MLTDLSLTPLKKRPTFRRIARTGATMKTQKQDVQRLVKAANWALQVWPLVLNLRQEALEELRAAVLPFEVR